MPHLEAKGLRVLTPAYPGFEVEVEALREDPQVIADLTVNATVDHLASVVESVATPPVIIGHSFGGTLTQLLLARGLGSAGVVIDSAPTEGVRVNPVSQARSLFPALKNPANRRRAVSFTPEEFHYAFTNTLTAEESQRIWERYAIGAPGNWVWEHGLFANFKPGHQDTWVDFKADRAPLLFIAGGKDHIMPPSVNRSNAKHYRHSPAVTDYHEFEERDHWTCGAPGWQEVADHALHWALDHAQPARPWLTNA
ncbi:alpha/beta fold hydrolase [Nocardioides sambongensis]|uniref:alpha/beta fold hydrolase n=1 Tax=Nocardioides sambongensis TaxID=2589074 RepID=UPI001E380028|nr:alpha/beta hydrolase [Nocardioides sambongensis]